MHNFFDFNSKLRSYTFQAYAGEVGHDKKGKYEGIDFPVIFKHDQGNKFTDILDTGWPRLFLISDHLKKILADNNLTGWKTYPIQLYDKKKREIDGYHGFSVTGNSGPINYNNSEIIERKLVSEGPI